MDESKKIQYIYDNIDKVKNHQIYIKLLTFHNCTYTTNSNGIFVNLNKLSENVINDFYIRINNELTNGDNIEEKYENEIKNIKEENEKIIHRNQNVPSSKRLNLDNFDEENIEIIEYSKKYEL